MDARIYTLMGQVTVNVRLQVRTFSGYNSEPDDWFEPRALECVKEGAGRLLMAGYNSEPFQVTTPNLAISSCPRIM